MSLQLINRSSDLRRLRDEGYNIEVRNNHLLMKEVPYVNSNKEVKRGVLISTLDLMGDVTTTPSTHVAYFIGEAPSKKDGGPISEIINSSQLVTLDVDLIATHTFSSKPTTGRYSDYYDKMTTYAAILSGPAEALDDNATARTFSVIDAPGGESVFRYIDTASSRAGINSVSKKLEGQKIAIVGLGGTGSYVLDLVSKTPVAEIHLFDGDKFYQHNAFRAPGAAAQEELQRAPHKVDYLAAQYLRMHKYVVPHQYDIGRENSDQLGGMDFVFLCLDARTARRGIVEMLEKKGIPFIDVGMGLVFDDGTLRGIVRVTTSTNTMREHVRSKNRIPLSAADDDGAYSQNIQIADLNALNAALAVIKWKKIRGFYADMEYEHFSTYTIDGNAMVNEDCG